MTSRPLTTWLWVPLLLVPLQLWFKDAAVVVLALLFLSAVVWQRDQIGQMLRHKGLLPWGLFALWCLIALSWTPEPSLASWAKPLFAVFMCNVLCISAVRLTAEQANAVLRRGLIVVGLLFVFLAIERLSGGALIQLYRADTPAPALFNVMRGGLVLLACASIPLAFWLWQQGKSLVPAVSGMLCVFGLSLTYRMDAVPLALLCGAIAFGLIYLRPQLGASFIVMLTGLITLLWPLIFIAALNQGLHEWVSEEVHPNWGYRIAIWGRVGELIMSNPMIGFGFNAAREVGQTANLVPAADGNTTFLHPHNGFLQLWLELGLIGIVLFGAAAAGTVRAALSRCNTTDLQATFAATWTTVVVIWLLSYGVWQSWWIAVIGLVAALFTVAIRSTQATSEP